MSLTTPHTSTERLVKSLIKNCIPSKELFYSNDGSKCFDQKKKCIISYGLESKHQSSLCGTAFDYLARFLIARVVKANKDTVFKELVAERFITTSSFYTITIDVKTKLHEEYEKLLTPIKKYIYGSQPEDGTLIDICIILAQMDLSTRSGAGVAEVSNIFQYDHKNSSVRTELAKMLDSFKKTFLPLINENSQVVYNPRFGIGSRIIGGADADIFIDGVLYDFKTSIKNGWSSADVTQIIGYFILDAMAKKCNDQRNWLFGHPIKKVALYKVRYEEIAFLDTARIPDDLLENTIKRICHTYLMYNISHFLLDERFEKIKKEYGFSLTKEELSLCSNMDADNLKCYLEDGDNLDEFLKEERDAIINSQNKMKSFLDSIDIICFFRALLKIHNANIEKWQKEQSS